MPTFMRVTQPIVGQEYISTQADHNGWRVLVKHVSEQSVQTECISPHHGEHYNYHIDQFLRDFKPVTPALATPLTPMPEPTSKLCPSCNTIKALTEFRLLPSRRGGMSAKRMSICSACNGLRIGKAMRAMRANKSDASKATTAATTLPTLSGKHLSEVLYDLAIKIAPLVSPDTLTALHDVVDDFLKTGVAAQGVYVFPADAVTKLTKANVRPQ